MLGGLFEPDLECVHTKRFLVVSRVRIFQCCLRCSMYNTAKLKTMLLWMQSFLHPGEVVLCTCGLLHVKSFAQCHHTTRSVRSHRPTRSVPHHRGGGYLAQPSMQRMESQSSAANLALEILFTVGLQSRPCFIQIYSTDRR